jgi:hypothetical protein
MPRLMNALRALVTLCLAAAAAACSSAQPQFPRASDVPGSIGIAELAVPDTVRPLVLTIYPTPRHVEYGEALLPLAGAVVLDDTAPDFDARVRAAGLDLGWKEMHPEGYVLHVTAENGHTVVVKAARDDAGRRWADEALAQLTWETAAGKFVRECRVLDAPVFALRGNKRPQAWESAYRANFAWGARDDADTRGRTMAAVYAPGIPLDATGEGVARTLEHFRPWQDRGVRIFVVKFDDEGFALTRDSELRFGKFAPALVGYLRLVRQGLRRRDADAKLYFLPQTYWWDDARFEAFSASMRAAGGLDEDVGLVVTGPEVVSDSIDAPGLAAARRAFGLTETKALIYDNLGREGDWGPLAGRDAALWQYADGVFGERGTPVNRLTRLDWLWNPQGYDPETSWRRAMLELAGPQGFERFEAVCRAFRRGATREDAAALVEAFAKAPAGAWKGPVARGDLVALMRGDCARLQSAAAAKRAVAPAPRN